MPTQTSIAQIKNLPKLRFPGFSDGWEEKKLGDIAEFLKGKGISKADITEDGKLECIRYGELYTKYRETINKIYSKTDLDIESLILSEANDVIIPASGETQIDIATASCVLTSNIALGGDLNIIRSKNNGVFLSYYLNSTRKLDIARLSQGISVVHLYASQLKTLKLNLPALPEQEKIATFLTTVDQKIEKIREKKKLLEEYKKGLMQKIFSQDVRFPGFSDEWDEKKLGDCLDISEKTKNNEFNPEKILTVKLNLNGIHKNNNTETLKEGATNYFVRQTGQFIYGKQNLFNGAFGIIPKDLDGFMSSGDIPALNINNKTIISKFLMTFMGRKGYYKSLEKYSSGSGSKRIHEKILLSFKIKLPSLPEQEKIANFFSAIDEKIEKVDSELDGVIEWKKGLLQGLFV